MIIRSDAINSPGGEIFLNYPRIPATWIVRTHMYTHTCTHSRYGKFVRRHRKLRILRSFLNIPERRTATVNRRGVRGRVLGERVKGDETARGGSRSREGETGYKRTLVTSSFFLSLSLCLSFSPSLFLSLSLSVSVI